MLLWAVVCWPLTCTIDQVMLRHTSLWDSLARGKANLTQVINPQLSPEVKMLPKWRRENRECHQVVSGNGTSITTPVHFCMQSYISLFEQMLLYSGIKVYTESNTSIIRLVNFPHRQALPVPGSHGFRGLSLHFNLCPCQQMGEEGWDTCRILQKRQLTISERIGRELCMTYGAQWHFYQ